MPEREVLRGFPSLFFVPTKKVAVLGITRSVLGKICSVLVKICSVVVFPNNAQRNFRRSRVRAEIHEKMTY